MEEPRHSKLLLQIRRAGGEGAAEPALEVHPAQPFLIYSKRSNLAVTGRDFICKEDLVITSFDSYDTAGSCPPRRDEDSLRERPIKSPIYRAESCTGASRGDNAPIAFEDGLLVATKLPKGDYEFSATDARGRVGRARWVKMHDNKSASGTTDPDEPRFKFF